MNQQPATETMDPRQTQPSHPSQPGSDQPPARRRWLAWTTWLVVALIAVGAAFYAGRQSAGGPSGAASSASATVKYHCPMHPTYITNKPGDCPICGMSLVKIQQETAPTQATQVKYHCPMHPTYTSNKPGDCPVCGMSLVKIEQARPGGEPAGQGPAATVPGRMPIFISPDRQQQIGLATSVVEKRSLDRSIRTVARVAYAEPQLAWVNTKFNGWIEKLHVNYTGQFVKKGQPLLEIYSPELVSAQQEYLIAVQASQRLATGSGTAAADGQALLAAARRRLQLWDITDAQIAQLEKTGEIRKTLTMVSPFDGHVVAKSALEGKAVMAGENLYRIADLSTVWLMADIYEYELPAVKLGQAAAATLSYLPGERFDGRVAYIYPYLEDRTRTVKVRIEAPNPGLKLKPDMWANVELRVESRAVLAIPASALIDTGVRHVAFVDKGDGHLQPREVKVGIRTDDYFEALDGVAAGERVVTRALFLVDSESQLRAAISGMGAGHDHGPPAAKSDPGQTHASDAPGRVMEPVPSVLAHYAKIQTALAGDSLAGVAEAAQTIAKLAADDPMKMLPAAIASQAGALARAADIATARDRLKPLSASLIEYLDQQKVQTGRYFEAYCDMAKAGWLQEGRAVRNPYYGKEMLNCGEVRKAR